MPSRKRFALPAMLAALLVLVSAGSASASSPWPWSPTSSSDFELPAGTRCPFTLRSEVLSDRELIRTLETFPDGSPKLQEVVGQLIVRFTNVEAGTSVERNLTGTAFFEVLSDGGFTLTLVGGHMGIGIPPGVEGGPAFLVFTGTGFSLTINGDGSREIVIGDGQVENICDTLASA